MKGSGILSYSDLDTLLDTIQRGTNLHISVVFAWGIASGKLRCSIQHVQHRKPICRYYKQTQAGLNTCLRCRLTVQNAIFRYKKPIFGYCKNGIYEYCTPVIWRNEVIAAIFIGNIYTGDKKQLDRMRSISDSSLRSTMEMNFTFDDCVNTANIISTYIIMLADRYGIERPDQDMLVENVKDFIAQNYADDFHGHDLAAIFGYNPKYLGRIFKSKAGITVREYCNAIRISKAKELLAETSMRIADIAYQVGFNNITYFTNVFVTLVGISPSAYRNSYKTSKNSES